MSYTLLPADLFNRTVSRLLWGGGGGERRREGVKQGMFDDDSCSTEVPTTNCSLEHQLLSVHHRQKYLPKVCTNNCSL